MSKDRKVFKGSISITKPNSNKPPYEWVSIELNDENSGEGEL